MADDKIRVLIVDDHPIFCDGLRANLEPEKDIQVVGVAMNGLDAVRLFHETKPDVTLMDIMLSSDMNGTQVLQAIRQEFPDAKIIMLSVRAEADVIRRSMNAGAASYISKDTLADDLMLTIRQVNAGWVTTSPEVERKLAALNSLKSISERELEVLRLMAEGMRNKEIAYHLKVERSTIDEHIKRIFWKLSVNDRTRAVMFAIELGLLEPPQRWK